MCPETLRPTRRMDPSLMPKASCHLEDPTTTQTPFAPSSDLELDSRGLYIRRLWALPGNINIAPSAALLGNSTELRLS
jgi:hypothetical protein